VDDSDQLNLSDVMGMMMSLVMLALVAQIVPAPQGELAVASLELS